MCDVGSGPTLEQRKQGKNQGNVKGNDYPELADTL